MKLKFSFLTVVFCVLSTNIQAAESGRLAVLFFENAVLPQEISSDRLGMYNVDPAYEPLEHALTDMCITDLMDKDIALVERARIGEMLREIELGSAGIIDTDTVQKLGRAAGAQYALYGIITKHGGKLAVAARVQEVKTGTIFELGDISAPELQLSRLTAEITKGVCRLPISLLRTQRCCVPIDAGSTIAVFPFADDFYRGSEVSADQVCSEMMMNTMIGDGKFRVVERPRLDAVLAELGFQSSGAVDETTALVAGKLLGARYVLLGCIVPAGKGGRLDARIISVETSETFLSAKIEGKRGSQALLARTLCRKLLERVTIR